MLERFRGGGGDGGGCFMVDEYGGGVVGDRERLTGGECRESRAGEAK